MLKAQKIWKNQVQTPMSWMTEKGLVEVCFKEADAYVTLTGLDGNIQEIPKEYQMGMPPKDFQIKHIPAFFSGVFPKVSVSKQRKPSVQFIRKCVGGMQIFIRDNSGKAFTLDVEPSDTINTVKLKFSNKIQKTGQFHVIYRGKRLLNDDRCLADYDITAEETIHCFMSMGFGGGGFNVKFNKMENQVFREFKETAPNYRIITSGLNLEGTCNNQSCEAFNERVWVQKGFGLFHMNEECHVSLCPLCQKEVEDVSNAAFHNCMYSISGKRQEAGKAVKVERECLLAPTDKLLTFKDQDEDIAQWFFLKIKVESREGIRELSGKQGFPPGVTIQNMKIQIGEKEGIPSDCLMMIYEDKLQEDGRFFDLYNETIYFRVLVKNKK